MRTLVVHNRQLTQAINMIGAVFNVTPLHTTWEYTVEESLSTASPLIFVEISCNSM